MAFSPCSLLEARSCTCLFRGSENIFRIKGQVQMGGNSCSPIFLRKTRTVLWCAKVSKGFFCFVTGIVGLFSNDHCNSIHLP